MLLVLLLLLLLVLLLLRRVDAASWNMGEQQVVQPWTSFQMPATRHKRGALKVKSFCDPTEIRMSWNLWRAQFKTLECFSFFFVCFFLKFFFIFYFLLFNLESEQKRLTVTNTEKIRNELMNSINRQVPQSVLQIEFEHFSNIRETELKERKKSSRVGLWLSW